MAATTEGQDKVLATAQRIVRSLHNTSDTDDMLLILSAFDNRLSTLSSFVSSDDPSSGAQKSASSAVDPRFEAAEQIILNEANSSALTDDYLAAVDELIQATEELNLNYRDGELQAEAQATDARYDIRDRAENALQVAMMRLEDEFGHILIRNTVPLDPERLHRSFHYSSTATIAASDIFDDDVSESLDDVSSGRYSHRRRGRGMSFGGDDVSLDLIQQDAVIDLRQIADRMIQSGYEKECCQVYCSVRRDVLDECLVILGVEKLSIEEVQRVEWRLLDDKMKKWIQAVKIIVRMLLPSEKDLCEQIFVGSDLIKEVCFLETSKGSVMQLLNFGEAIAIGRRSSEKLFRILDMFDALAGVLPDLQSLFMDEEAGDMVCSEAKGVLDGLGEAAIGTFMEFENAVQTESSRKTLQNGEIHPLTRYVMNYVKLLVDYSDTLNALLENAEDELRRVEIGNIDNSEMKSMSLIGQRLLALMKSLESNLEEKSRMYEDTAMQYIFLMNNILYIVQKVKDSELQNLLGDNWIKKRRGQIRQYATQYLRASWSNALSCLKDVGIGIVGSSSNASKVALKERFKNFNACFEDIYRVQTAWKVPDPQLREELRISISEKVLPAYRAFVGRFGSHLESGRNAGKYIKYTPDELENYLLDLFEGTPLILHHMRRKST
ncbi:exocyst complex component EXO70B1-like [Olea europaea var. sylvestris]|uniref:exocyst complex component EXO70B1-like n=1 Tax=Olea europaea var. sylvestris TaxID=158386 RepID=UPI000C1CF2B8|nr:exocyst complex component EXO70B1-like [Olea europaea var. sylvestris]